MTRAVRGWYTAAAVLTFASVVMGSVVCATRSGAACPQWPGCYPGQFVPAAELNPLIEFTHRVVAAVTGPAVLVAAVLGRRLRDPRPRRLAWLGLAGTLSAGVFGMLTVKVGIPWWMAVIDLATAFLAVVATLLARLLLAGDVVLTRTRAAATAWATLGVVATMHLLALAVSGVGSLTGCLGWPLGVLEIDRWPWLQATRVVLAVTAVVLLMLTLRRAAPGTPASRAARLVFAGIVVEYVLGALVLAGAGGPVVRTASAVVASAVFGGLAFLACRLSAVRMSPTSDLVPA